MKRITIATVALSLIVGSCSAAYAQPQCGPQEVVVKYLSEEHGESVKANALTGTPEVPVLVEIWTNSVTNTWSIDFLHF